MLVTTLIMGYADMLLMKEIAYGSREAIDLLEKILAFMEKISIDESEIMGKEYGVPLQCQKLPEPRRNITTNTVAPTGCQKKDTLVVTDKGILELQELGDINGERWQKIKINVAQENAYQESGNFFVNNLQNTKVIKLSSGIELESTYNHQYRVLEDGKYIWKEADKLGVGDILVIPLGTYTNTNNPILKSSFNDGHFNENEIFYPKTVTKELAEFLGILFGDGSFHKKGIRLHFNSTEEDYLYVSDLGKKLFGISPTIYFDKREKCVSVCFNSSKLLRWLKENDFVKNKAKNIIFTKAIRQFSKENLLAFMDGFYFADGSHSGSVRYIDTASKVFAQQWVVISRALGKDARIQKRVSGLGGTMYRVYSISTKRIIETKEIRNQLDKLNLNNCTVDTVLDVENSKANTFDIEVLENNCYIANSVVSHNTISLIAGCSSGIEPIFSEITVRNDKTGTYTFENDLAEKPYFRCAVSSNGAQEVTWEEHIETLAATQRHIQSGVSKTINFPNNAKRESIANAVMLAWQKGCKGLAVYRNGSRKIEVLSPRNIKKDLCPMCGKDMVEINGSKRCIFCTKESLTAATSTYYD